MSAFLEKQSPWSAELEVLRTVFIQTELREEINGDIQPIPCKENGWQVSPFLKSLYHLVLSRSILTDPYKKLHNAQKGKTRGLRQWKFVKGDTVPSEMILEYLYESIENSKAGKHIKPTRPKSVVIPPILLEALSSDKDLYRSFQNLTPGRQREYAEYIGSAKKVETQISV